MIECANLIDRAKVFAWRQKGSVVLNPDGPLKNALAGLDQVLVPLFLEKTLGGAFLCFVIKSC